MTAAPEPKKTSLFSRIMIRLTLPLLLLSAVFTGTQQTNQMNAMNEFYKIESRYAFDSIQKALSIEMKNEKSLTDLQTLGAKLETMSQFHHVAPLQIFDLLDRKPLFVHVEPQWIPLDHQGIEESLYQKQLGNPYHVRVDKKARKLIAYIPLEGPSEAQIFAARVIVPLASVKGALNQSAWTLALMIFFITLTGIYIGRGLAQSIIKPIRTLNEATREIVKGHLGKSVDIRTGDEIQTLGETFNHMSDSLQAMQQRAEDANPLTQLPGNQGIFHELSKRIHERQKFVLFHTDLDRFKIFNDHYGLARGDEAIKKTARLLKQAVDELGAPDDFIGHQGGDDFIVVTRPNHAKEVAEHVIKHFDGEVVKSLYRKEDYERGYTLEVDRRRLAETGEEQLVKFSLLAISLAGVSNAKRDFADYFECMSSAVEAKKEAKKVVTSSYVIRE